MVQNLIQVLGKSCKQLVILGCAFGASLVGNNALAADAPESTIVGAGASFPAPVYSKWATEYLKSPNPVFVNYQSVGSSSGVAQIKIGLVDFGASDYPLSQADLQKYNLIQIPTLAGGIVVVANLKELTQPLVLDGATLADIYLGKITKWNDPAIRALNPEQNLPDLYIAVLFRSDGSGTTYNFTKYLTEVSTEFNEKIGYSKAVNFPVGLGGKGNEGVAAVLPRVNGAIGYLEYGYANILGLKTVNLKTPSGEIVSPSYESFAKALSGADWSASNTPSIINLDVPGAWPINALTYIMVKRDSGDLKNVKKFFEFGMTDPHQQQETRKLLYVPLNTDIATGLLEHLPEEVVKP